MQCYTTQRDPAVFPNPEVFDPERWKHETKEMLNLFMPFSKGSRACLGINLAWMELRVALATLVGSLSFSPVTPPAEMEMVDRFLLKPKGGKCLLQFRLVEDV